ncbi:MAG TPA: hypothetical protein VI215_13825 [Bacteroidota bacterium]
MTRKATITIETDLDKDLETFQSTEAKHDLELITIAVTDSRTEIEERELKDGVIMITISDEAVANDVVKSLRDSDFMAQIVDRKAWLREQKKKRKEDKAKEKA